MQFFRYSTCKRVRGHSRASKNFTIRSGVHNFLLTFHSNHRPISHCFRGKRRFQSKITEFSHPRVFNFPAEGVPLGIGYRRKGSKKLKWGGYPRRSKKFKDTFNCLDTIPAVTDRQPRRRSIYLAYYVTRVKMALSRVHTSFKTDDIAILLLVLLRWSTSTSQSRLFPTSCNIKIAMFVIGF